MKSWLKRLVLGGRATTFEQKVREDEKDRAYVEAVQHEQAARIRRLRQQLRLEEGR